MEDGFQRLVRSPCLALQRFQLLNYLRNRPVLLTGAGMDVAAGGDVEVVLRNLVAGDDAAVFLHLAPRLEGIGDPGDGVLRDVVLRVALGELAAGVQQEKFPLALFRLRSVQEENDAGRAGVVEQVFRQVDDAFDEVLLHEPAAHVLFLVGVRIAGAARGGACVEHDGGAARVAEAGEDVLRPAPVRLVAGEARALGEAVEFVGVVVLLGELCLVPHGIGHRTVEGLEAIALAEFWMAEGVADLDPALHVMDDHVHTGHRPGGGRGFLTVESERGEGFLAGGLHFSIQPQLALDEQTAGAAGGIIAGHARLGVHDQRHDLAYLARRVELASALPAALSELADEIFVTAPDDVRLHVAEPETLFTDALDEVGEAVVVNVAHAVGGGVEVHAVNDALEQRVFIRDGAEMRGESLADLVRKFADDGPDSVVGVGRLKRQVEADEFLVVLHQLERLGPRADFLRDAVQFVIKDIAEALGEDERKDVVLELGCILRAPNGTGRIPNPGFQGFDIFFRHLSSFYSNLARRFRILLADTEECAN